MDARNAAIAVAHSWRACGRKRHDWMLCWTSQLKTRQLSANERVWLHEYLSAKVIHAGKRLHLVALDLTVAPEGSSRRLRRWRRVSASPRWPPETTMFA